MTCVAHVENVRGVCVGGFVGFGLSPLSVKGEERKLTLHRYIETLKFANGQKKNIRDLQHSQQKVSTFVLYSKLCEFRSLKCFREVLTHIHPDTSINTLTF